MSKLTELYEDITTGDTETRRQAITRLAMADRDFNILYHAHTDRKHMENCLIDFSGDRLNSVKSIRQLVNYMKENEIVRFTMSQNNLEYAYAFQESGCKLIKLTKVRAAELWGTRPKTVSALLFEIVN